MADWAKLDVGFFRHPQVVQLGAKEKLGYIAMILYAQEYETDGHVPDPALRLCDVGEKQIAAMEQAGLVNRNGTGWIIDGFTRKQRTKAELEARRKQRSAAAHARWDHAKETPDAP
jgi:hypothetical protein